MNLFTPIGFYGRGYDPTAQSSAHAAQSDARHARTEVELLHSEVERLFMVTKALWSILKENGYTDEDLAKRIQDIDLADGKLDGKIDATAPKECPQCHRTLMKARPRCIYCGAAVIANPFER